MRLILKSIFSHLSVNMPLLIEIVAVTIIGWIVIEPVAVKTSVASLPAGYDHERLVLVHLSSMGKDAEGYDTASISTADAYRRLLDMLRQRDGVETATYVGYQSFESDTKATSYLDADSSFRKDGEELGTGVIITMYVPESDFFSTFGIQGADGKPFDEPRYAEHSYIVTKTLAEMMFPGGNPIGKNLYPYDESDEDDRPSPIVGVIDDVIYNKGDDRAPIAFRALGPEGALGFAVRLKEGVSARDFTDRLTADLSKYRSGNFYLTHPELYSDMREEIFSEGRRELLKGWLMVLFFMVNVLFGVAGTFYVQTRRRISDAGVMRAFGATRRRVEGGIVGEACVITIVAWGIGCLLYLCYLHFSGDSGTEPAQYIIRVLRPMWHDTASVRNTVITGILLLVLLELAVAGSWLPARKVGRVNPIDALRDE
ncbi:MAG: FtsX-like permease family protein [Muribaculaceae bacterium]|nr:FtsX-like permease family protein [Muribaculaceae bacterium]